MVYPPRLPLFFLRIEDVKRTYRRSSISPSRSCHYMPFGLVDEPSTKAVFVPACAMIRRAGSLNDFFYLR
jgi:hypothetical protein